MGEGSKVVFRDPRVEEEAFRREQRRWEGWPERAVFAPRPDPEVARGVEVTDPGLRASARLEHLRGWGGPGVLRAMGWPDKAAELERLEEGHAARLNRVEARGASEEPMAQLLPLEPEEMAEAIRRLRADPVRRHQARLRAARDLRRADRLRARAGRETGWTGGRRAWKGLSTALPEAREAGGKRRLPAAPEGV